MDETPFYPNLTTEALWPVQIVRQHLTEDPAYLDHPSCPYSEELRTRLKTIFSSGAPHPTNSTNEDFDLQVAVDRLYAEINEYGETVRDPSEKNTYFRVSFGLLEKLVSLKERAVGIQRVNEFKTVILEIMDRVLEPDQRTTVMKELRKVLGD